MALQTGTQFVEDLYGSAMSLAVNLESLTLDGTYATYNSAGMLGGYVHGYLKGFGQAVLTGKLRLQEGKGTIITGRWVHTPGPLSNGEFEVSWDAESKCMKGWWAEAINDFYTRCQEGLDVGTQPKIVELTKCPCTQRPHGKVYRIVLLDFLSTDINADNNYFW